MQTLSIPKKKRIYAIAFSPSGDELAAVCGDGHLRIWDLASGNVTRSMPISLSCDCLLYIDSNSILLSGDGLFRWDLSEGEPVQLSPDLGWVVRLSPDGGLLALVDPRGEYGEGLAFRETSTWQRLLPAEEADHTTGGLAFSPDGRRLATAHVRLVGQKIRQWHGVNEYDYLVHIREMPSAQIIRTFSGWQQSVTHLAFSPDGAFLAGTAGIRLRVWDLEADRELAHHKRGPKHFQGLAFTADGRFLATVSNDETVRIWDARTWEEHTTYAWKVGQLLNIAFAPDGLRAAAGSDKGQIVLWDVG